MISVLIRGGHLYTQKDTRVLTSVAQLTGHSHANQQVTGSIPGWAHAWVAGSIAKGVCGQGTYEK